MVKSQVNERLAKIIQLLKLSQSELARKTGLTKSTISLYLRMKHDVSLNSIELILAALPEVNPSYLRNGVGHPLLTGDEITDGPLEPKSEYSGEDLEKMITIIENEIQDHRKIIGDKFIVLFSLRETLSNKLSKKLDTSKKSE